jgi:O-antigen/teichoic acid export membrane protein
VIRISGSLITDSMLVFYPRMVSLLQHENLERFTNTNLQSIRLFTTLAIPLSVGLFLLSEPFTDLYFGRAFNHVYTNIKILALYPFIKSYSLYITKQMLQPFGHDKLVVRGLLTGDIVLVTGMLILCPYWQDAGASVSLILSEIATAVYFTWWMRKRYAHIQLFDFITLLQAVGTSLLFIPIKYIMSRTGIHTLPQFFLMVVACIIVYFVVQLVICRNKVLLMICQFALKTLGAGKNA